MSAGVGPHHADVSDCIAMSEDGYSWFAFPKTMKRGQVMAALARSAEDIGYGDWQWFVTHHRIYAGHVHAVPPPDGMGGPWHKECTVTDEGAFPAWIVRSKP